MTRAAGRRRRTRTLTRVRRLTVTVGVVTVAAAVTTQTLRSADPNNQPPPVSTERTALSRATLTPVPVPTRTATSTPKPVRARVPPVGSGTYAVAAGTSTQGAAGQVITYQVEVEKGVPYGANEFAARVDRTLKDRRGWSKNGAFTFNRRESATRRVVLASPKTVDRLCAPLQTRGEVSCRNGNVVAINARRWAEGATSYKGDLADYRTYVINHEVGHSLGFNHEPCLTPGRPAPVMLQQTLGLEGCTKNPWP